ncbi:hypothetical protein PspLS_05207 [Pyricularia sp. CBS 133598]|nr:hypothetical protein PspLS_05207 [Pyricularia sp. CBS 133598]
MPGFPLSKGRRAQRTALLPIPAAAARRFSFMLFHPEKEVNQNEFNVEGFSTYISLRWHTMPQRQQQQQKQQQRQQQRIRAKALKKANAATTIITTTPDPPVEGTGRPLSERVTRTGKKDDERDEEGRRARSRVRRRK